MTSKREKERQIREIGILTRDLSNRLKTLSNTLDCFVLSNHESERIGLDRQVLLNNKELDYEVEAVLDLEDNVPEYRYKLYYTIEDTKIDSRFSLEQLQSLGINPDNYSNEP